MSATVTIERDDIVPERGGLREYRLYLVYTGRAGAMPEPVQRVLQVGETALGREVAGPRAFAVADDSVSAHHATLRLSGRDETLSIVDQGSKNGTFVNGQRVSESPLADGDVVRLGLALAVLRHEPARVPDAEVTGLLGCSHEIRQVRALISRTAQAFVPVLITGETGTGKELVARALHERSGRQGPLVVVNCPAIPESLAESQLFGHVDRAFTEARAQPGHFGAARGGTLLFDEIGELPQALQPKLLRALENQEVIPVGAALPVRSDARVVSATNRDLCAEVLRGGFREDLYARLCKIEIAVPPLRRRRQDILLLLHHRLAENHRAHPAYPIPTLSPRLAEVLLLYGWPRNVREIDEVAVHLMIVRQDQAELAAELLRRRAAAEPAEPPGGDEETGKERLSRERLVALFKKHAGNVAGVARETGWSPRTLRRRAEEHGLDLNAFRGS